MKNQVTTWWAVKDDTEVELIVNPVSGRNTLDHTIKQYVNKGYTIIKQTFTQYTTSVFAEPKATDE